MKKFWDKIQEFLDIKGGAILGVWSMMMISLCCYSVLAKWPLPDSIVTAYGIVVGAFAGKKVSDSIVEGIKKIKGK
jgi:hypothetical protein